MGEAKKKDEKTPDPLAEDAPKKVEIEESEGGEQGAPEGAADVKGAPDEDNEDEKKDPDPDDTQPLDADAVKAALESTNLPTYFKAHIEAGEYADEEALKNAISEAVAEVKRLTGSGQVTGLGESQAAAGEQPDQATLEERSKDSFNEIMKKHGLREV